MITKQIFDKGLSGMDSPSFWLIENSQLGWEFQKAYSFGPVIKTPFDLLE